MKHLNILQPFVLSCCYSSSSDLVMETFLLLQRILKDLTWYQSSSFIIKLTFTLVHFFEEESEQLRLTTFEMYENVLAKVSRMTLVFPLRHQVLSLLMLLVFHLKDVNAAVVEVCRLILCRIAVILHWSKLKAVFAKNDVFTILSALVSQKLMCHSACTRESALTPPSAPKTFELTDYLLRAGHLLVLSALVEMRDL